MTAARRAGALVVLLTIAGCGAVPARTPDARRPAKGWTAYHDASRGFSVEFPSAWRRAAAPLTPNLADPRELLALGTGRLPAQRPGDGCAHMPSAPVARLPVDGVLVTVMERQRPGAGYPARPPSFRLTRAGQDEGLECIPGRGRARVWWLAFRDGRRAFYALVTVGRRAPRARVEEAERVLDSLRFADPAPGAGRERRE